MLFDYSKEYKGRAIENIEPPVINTPVVHGASGAVTAEYVATFKTLVGETTPTIVASISTAPTTLSSVNYVTLSVNSVAPNAVSVRYFKKDGSVYKLLGEQTALTGANGVFAQYNDIGQTLDGDILVPTTNTSGRPQWRMLLWNFDRYVQRSELMDIQLLLMSQMKRVGDLTWKNGDITSGCQEREVSNNVYTFTSGTIYLDGQVVEVPEGTVTLTGTGTEKVGLLVTPRIETYEDDPALWNLDLPNDLRDVMKGADRLVYDIAWAVDELGMVLVKEFLDGDPLVETLPIERTVLDQKIASVVDDLIGPCVTDPFPIAITAHPSDDDYLIVGMGASGSTAYVDGYRNKKVEKTNLLLPKARTVQEVQNSGLGAFNYAGGYVITGNAGDYNVDGLKMRLAFGSGGDHDVTFTGNGQTATQVAGQITAAINVYPSEGTLVTATVSGDNKFQLRAPSGKSLHVKAIASDAYTVLGLTVGENLPGGQRIYPINDEFIRDVTDCNYLTEVVEQVVHNESTNMDLLDNTNVISILGVSTTAAKAHDSKYDYFLNVDFHRTGNYVDWTIGGTTPSNGSTVYVKYQYNHNAVKSTLRLAQAIDVPITKGAEDGQDNLTLTGAASVVRTLNGAVITGLTGAVKNVVSIDRVNNTTGQSATQYSLQALLKNSTALTHATSQIDWSAAGAQGGGLTGQPVTAATYYVTYTFWYEYVAGDYVTSDCYDMYDEIESFGAYDLRDCMDFRTSGAKPVPDESPTFDYNAYLGRIDKIAIDQNGRLSIIPGQPALYNPPVPKDQPGLLTLKVLNISPYTYGPTDVMTKGTEPVRKTQRGLASMESRLSNVEYAIAKREIETTAIQEAAGSDTCGILTDALTGWNRVDLGYDVNGISHTCAIDTVTQTGRLAADQTVKTLTIDEANSSGFRRIGNTLLLDFQETILVSQPLATKTINVNPDNVPAFGNGTLEVTPSNSLFVDTTQAPDMTVDFDNNMTDLVLGMIEADPGLKERYFGTIWSNWSVATPQEVATAQAEGTWGGIVGHTEEVARSMGLGGWQNVGMNARFTRTGQTKSLVPERNTIDMGNRVVDMTLVPMVRTTDENGAPFILHLTGHGLMPLTDHAVTIANIAVDATIDTTVSNYKGTAGSELYLTKSTVKTDAAGSVHAKFTMPSGVKVGNQSIRIFHYATPSTSQATCNFFSQGWNQVNQGTTVGMTSLVERVGGDGNEFTQVVGSWGDPLAYSILQDFSDIAYIAGVKIRFATKPAIAPVTVEMREMLNGYPTRKVLASCTLYPDDISTSSDASLATEFMFENILGYKRNEYAVAILCNTDEATVWICELGEIDITSGITVMSQPYGGVLFHSPNNSTWEAMTKTDLCFELIGANFQNNCQLRFNSITGLQASMLAMKVNEALSPTVGAFWAYQLDGSTRWVAFNPDLDTNLGSIVSQVDLIVNVAGLGGSYALVEQVMGIVLLLHQAEGYHVATEIEYSDALNYPNSVDIYVSLDTDGVNGAGVRSVSPLYTADQGENVSEILMAEGWTPTAVTGAPGFYKYKFSTPAQALISAATNATPIVVTSAGHRFTENMVVDVAEGTGNTAMNGTWRLKNVDLEAGTAELVDPITGDDSVGNGAYGGSGTMTLAEMSRFRGILKLETTNRATTPIYADPRFITARVVE